MTLFVAPIVEGETEEGCIKILLRRIWVALGGAEREPLAVLDAEPAHRTALVKDGHPELGEKFAQMLEEFRIRSPLRMRPTGQDAPARRPLPANGPARNVPRQAPAVDRFDR